MSRHSAYLRKACFAAAFAVGLAGLAAPAAADVSQLIGNWVNQDNDTSGVTRVVVTHAGPDRVNVHVFGQCHPSDCDWGTVPGHSYFEGPSSNRVTSVMARFHTGFGNKIVILRDVAGPRLNYEVLTDFTDNSGRRDYDMSGGLRRAMLMHPMPMPMPAPGPGPGPGPGAGGYGPGGGLAEDCLPEPYANLHVSFVGGAWKIVNGNEWVLSFGSNKAAAQRSLAIIKHYRFDEICYVVRPHAAMTYWKRNGHVPSGNIPGQDCIHFNPNQVTAAHVGGAWKVVQGSMWMLDYGSNKAGAEKAVDVIKHYNLNRQCFVARPNPPMEYWLSQ